MKNWLLFFITWFLGLLLFQVGEFFYLDFDFVVVEASSQLASEVSFAHWQFNTPPIQATKVYISPEVAKSPNVISKLYKGPVVFQAFTFAYNNYLSKSEGNTFILGYLSGIPLFLLNRLLRL
ncbi:hypothetical protein AHMF7605_12170 [Adhaeribacter arboris]|uniref:Uncharacterized protein n=1 Tax=Adhaeribacter arboris TaxID=2072846 RepID=A0A2T2YFE5_9BACT|nr:hypothetical protein [Adhaeribacter arboris]PSR54224.1 hypothetical protein AHMF7605_12170 [Adhaeribacter arboris]